MAQLTLDGFANRPAAACPGAPTTQALPASPKLATAGSWLDRRLRRLSAWAEAQPPHHRLGNWLHFSR